MSAEGRRRWLALALGLSLVLNLFLAGLISGRVFASFDPVRAAAARAPGFAARFRALPEDDRQRFNAVYDPYTKEVVAARQSLRAARLKAFGALGAPIYDKQLMQQEFDGVLQATVAAQRIIHRALVEAFATLTPQARATLAGIERLQ